MAEFKLLLKIIMTSVLVNNYVLSKFLGICPFLGVSKKLLTTAFHLGILHFSIIYAGF